MSWNSGKTKQTEPKLVLIGRNISLAKKGKPHWSKKPGNEEKVELWRENCRIQKIGIIPWNKGLTKEQSPSIASAVLKNAGRPGPLKGKTKKTDSRLLARSLRFQGRTKQTNPGIARRSEKIKGRRPWNKGLTKDNDPRMARQAQNLIGRRSWCKGLTKEQFPQLAKSEIVKEKIKNKVGRLTRILCGRKPNKQEFRLQQVLDMFFPNQWQYVGNGQLVIGGKCPDFVNVNSQKKIIELFGDYWHKGEDPEYRTGLFSSYGFQTLVLWEFELRNAESLIQKVVTFMEKARA